MTIDPQAVFIAAGVGLLLVLALAVLGVALWVQLRKQPPTQPDAPQLLPLLAVMTEKLAHIEPVTQTLGLVQADLRGVSEHITALENNHGLLGQGVGLLSNELRGVGERMATVERNQAMVQQGVGYLATNTLSAMTELKSLTNGLTDATGAMRAELTHAKNDLTALETHVRAEQEAERQIAESIRRLEMIIAGTQSKGAAGENVLELVFSKLPVEWQVRDFRLGGKPVEFALRLPNNLILPIDSKWTATALLEQFVNAAELPEQQRLKRAIEEAGLQKAREVRKYLDPSVTANFGLAVLPDAVYDLCAGILAQTFQLNVVLVSYSMFVPYLLLVFQTTLKNSQSIDLHKLEVYLRTAQESVQTLQEELDGRFSRALTMMNNSRDEMRAVLGKLSGSLTGLQLGAGAAPLPGPDPALPQDPL